MDESDDSQPAPVLHTETSGSGSRVVLVHGFAQNRNCWGPLPDLLAAGRQVVRVDAPGHGGSAHVRADLPTAGRLLVETGGEATYLGYSLGGRICLHAALGAPGAGPPAGVKALVLVSATAGIDDPADRERRRAEDDSLALRVEAEGVAPVVDEWVRRPMFSGVPERLRFVEERRTNTAEGLASSLRLAGAGTQTPQWDRLSELRVPVLVVAGATDERYAALGQRMKEAIGTRATLLVVGGAGHAVHLEQPATFAAALSDWLDRNT